MTENKVKPTKSGYIKKKRRLVERELPTKPDLLLPESQLYTRLLNFERQLEATIARKHVELAEANRPSLRVKSVLRIYIFNDIHPQSSAGDPASWTLRIQGVVLDQDTGQPARVSQKCLSNYFSRIVIQYDEDPEYIGEWRKATAVGLVDGFEFRRIGNEKCKVRISMWLDSSPARFKLERSLVKPLEIESGTRVELLAALWKFLHSNELWDESQGHARAHSDLQIIFGTDTVLPMPNLLKRFALFFQPPAPYVFKYKVRVKEAPLPDCYDLKVDTPETWVPGSNSSFASHHSTELTKLQEEMALLIANAQSHMRRREFMLAFAEAPRECIEGMVVTQAAEHATTNPKLLDAEAARTAAYYEQDWVPDAVDRYLSNLQPSLSL